VPLSFTCHVSVLAERSKVLHIEKEASRWWRKKKKKVFMRSLKISTSLKDNH